jgi:CRP/FNR family transcriptional regulator, cyclic AMP receptor protein
MVDESISKELRGFQFFVGLDSAYVEFLASHATRRHFDAAHVMHRQGDPATGFYVVTSGNISIEVPAIQGPTLHLQALGPGDMLGWSWLIPPYRWSFLVRTEAPVDLIEFDGKAVLDKCEADPKFGYEMLKRVSALMSERLAHARQRMIDEWSAAGFA